MIFYRGESGEFEYYRMPEDFGAGFPKIWWGYKEHYYEMILDFCYESLKMPRPWINNEKLVGYEAGLSNWFSQLLL